MFEYYIKKIHIGQVRHLKDVDIPICEDKCRHLILTGRNGSGKTSLLEAMREYFELLYKIFDKSNKINSVYKIPQNLLLLSDASLAQQDNILRNTIHLNFNVKDEEQLEVFNQHDIVIAFFQDARDFSSPQPKRLKK